MIKKQRKSVAEQIKVLNEMAETLDFKCRYYETAIKNGTAAIVREMNDNEIPPQFVKVRKRLKKISNF